jgi:hypothetical protein
MNRNIEYLKVTSVAGCDIRTADAVARTANYYQQQAARAEQPLDARQAQQPVRQETVSQD